ncbi:MAG: hypothetical protein NTY96_05425 [Bacteroidetes bacterium]|nr:hypothetical protein [Bacteroidota bacterium]
MLFSIFNSTNGKDSNYVTIGAMSAPLKFIAISEDDQVQLTPRGTVKIHYGYRLPVLISMILFIELLELFIRRKP